MIGFVALHTFEPLVTGRLACRKCRRYWVDIRNVTEADIGKPHIACEGSLLRNELEQIIAFAAKEDERTSRATSDLASGAYAPPPTLQDDDLVEF